MYEHSAVSPKQPRRRWFLTAIVASLATAITPAMAQLTITCPDDMTVAADSNTCSAVVAYPAPIVTGASTGAVVVCTPPSGSTFPVGVNEVLCTVTDGELTNSCTFSITVESAYPPAITDAMPNKSYLWPPNHKMIKVKVYYDVTGSCDQEVTTSLSVTSNESLDGLGDGHTALDWEVRNDHCVLLRAERSGKGEGRIYTITITATDATGNSTSEDVTVTVPHNKPKKVKSNKGKHKGQLKK